MPKGVSGELGGYDVGENQWINLRGLNYLYLICFSTIRTIYGVPEKGMWLKEFGVECKRYHPLSGWFKWNNKISFSLL